MTANLRLVASNVVDDATLSVFSGTEILPVENIQNPARGRIFRGVAGTIEIRGTYTSNVKATMASLIRHNSESAGTWRWKGYSDAAWSSLVQDTGSLSIADTTDLDDLDVSTSLWESYRGQQIAAAWFDLLAMSTYSSETIRSWSLTVSDATNSTGYTDIGRVFAGKHFEFTENPVYGSKIGWKESSQSWVTDGGGLHVDGSVGYRLMTLDLQYMPEADRQQLMDILRYCGMRRDLFVDLLPNTTGEEARDWRMNALIQSMPDLSYIQLDRHSNNLILREV